MTGRNCEDATYVISTLDIDNQAEGQARISRRGIHAARGGIG